MHCETGRIPCSLRERMECVRRRSRAQYGEDVHLLPLLLEATGGSGATLRALPWRGIGVVRPSILRAPPSRGAAPTAPAQFLSAAS